MNCRQLLAILDKSPPQTLPPEALAHLAHCARCRQAWGLVRETRKILRTLPEPPLPPELATRVLAFTQDRHTGHRRFALPSWGLALAATLLLGIGIGVSLTFAARGTAGYRVQGQVLVVPAGSVTTVHIALDSVRSLQNVAFVVKVPEGMQLQGHPGAQQVAWNGELAQGRNVLNLDLLAAPGTAGILEADVHYANHTSTLKLRVAAAPAPSLRDRVHRWLTRLRAA